tara:strand:- start:642987 stop:643433 length:447 start_codon:yes stop_codon:yes gene_type:complete
MTFSVTRRVEFRDTDAAGIVHFSAFFPMMESAEHELLRSVGIPILPVATGSAPALTWPRVSVACDYISAARFEDVLQIHVRVIKIGNSSLQYGFEIVRDEQAIANGTMTTVCCQLAKDPATGATHLEKSQIPDSIRALLAPHVSPPES